MTNKAEGELKELNLPSIRIYGYVLSPNFKCSVLLLEIIFIA